jgi:hypothetical protein
MAILLDPTEPQVREATDASQEILSRLGAKPFLARLEAAMERHRSEPTPEPERSQEASSV